MGLLLLLVGVSAFFLLSNPFSADDPSPAPIAIPRETTSGEPPTLTRDQRAAALEIAHADPRVAPLLENAGASTLVVPWVTLESNERLGAGIDVTWTSPITVSDEWPVLFYDQTEAEFPPYQETTATVHVRNLTGVHLAIDLEHERVLGIEAIGDATVDSFVLPSDFHNTLPPQPPSD